MMLHHGLGDCVLLSVAHVAGSDELFMQFDLECGSFFFGVEADCNVLERVKHPE